MAASNTINTIFPSCKSVSPVLSGFALLSLCVDLLDAVTTQFSHLLCALTAEVFKALPSIMFAGFQAFETYALSHPQFLAICHELVSAWPTLHFVFRATQALWT